MTVRRLAWAFLLLLPVACSNARVNPGLAPADQAEDDELAAREPQDAEDFLERGDGYAERGEYQKALADYKEALRLAPDNADACNSLAWLLATCPDDGVRDGRRAVELATKACRSSDWKDADYLGTLAAAHAECGDFKEAVKWQKEALKLGLDDEEARRQLKLYQQGKPYREK